LAGDGTDDQVVEGQGTVEPGTGSDQSDSSSEDTTGAEGEKGTEGEAKEPEVSPEIAALQAEIAKLTNDTKSLTGRLSKANETIASAEDISTKLEVISKIQQMEAKARLDGTFNELDTSGVEAEVQQQARGVQVTKIANGLYQDLILLAGDGDEEKGKEAIKGEEYSAALETWVSGLNDERQVTDLSALYNAKAQVAEVLVRKGQTAANEAAVAAQLDAGKTKEKAEQQVRDELGADDTGAGVGAGSAAQSDDALLKKLGDSTQSSSPKELARGRKILVERGVLSG
tara:strand:+ start:2916 stop:3773 length:858 start_codon:yes stop_codon:yes gene_type:complete